MSARRRLVPLCLICGIWIGCNAENGERDGSVPEVDAAKVDAADGSSSRDMAPDALVAPTGPARLTTIIDRITLPLSGEQYAMDYDGTGEKNQMGVIVGAMDQFGNDDFQKWANENIKNGTTLSLIEVFADSIVDDAAALARFSAGKDLDSDPSDNFTGSEAFGIAEQDPAALVVKGAISGARLTTIPSNATMVNLDGTMPYVVTRIRMMGDLSDSHQAITGGQLNSVIPQSELDAKFFPLLAKGITDFINDPNSDPLAVSFYKNMDTNKDGVVDVDELKKDKLVGQFIAPDVDTDGDGKPDAMSMGYGFTAVPCKIKR